ncbi:alkaline phosphatase [Aegicerativicinus sediminis]
MLHNLKKIAKRQLYLVLIFPCLIWSNNYKEQSKVAQNDSLKKPKNIILLIGDGMGLSQVSSIYFDPNYTPNFNRFHTIGLITVSSASELITDSAAAATSFASGEKTYNGAIGVNIDQEPLVTIVDLASDKQMKTGIISTSSITHATPACFYAHVEKRRMQDEIATFLPVSDIDFFAGGGTDFFNNRKDERNLTEEFVQNGFTIDTTLVEDYSKLKDSTKYGFLMAPNGMKSMIDGRGDFLPTSSALAIEYLSKSKDGFFLMIEGSQIDWGGHGNDGEYIKSEMLDFDQTIGKVLDFAKQDGNTLVIVTADHETGGYTLASNGSNYNEILPSFSTTGHSATLIPVFAYGPGEEIFSGIYENTEIFHKMKLLLE